MSVSLVSSGWARSQERGQGATRREKGGRRHHVYCMCYQEYSLVIVWKPVCLAKFRIQPWRVRRMIPSGYKLLFFLGAMLPPVAGRTCIEGGLIRIYVYLFGET